MIKLNLYGNDDKVVKTLSRTDVRWGVLKKVVKLQSETDIEIDEQLDRIVDVIADCFGVETDEIERGARVEDMLACMREIATQVMASGKANFTTGAAKKK